MQRVRKSKEGVSPVIATILMVAITVVLAAVLYVLVSGFLTVGGGPRSIGVNVSRASDGNYTVKIVQSISGLQEGQTKLTATRGSTILLGGTSQFVTALTCAAHNAEWVQPAISTTVNAGDFIVLVGTGNSCDGVTPVTNAFVVGDALEIADSAGILWSGKIN